VKDVVLGIEPQGVGELTDRLIRVAALDQDGGELGAGLDVRRVDADGLAIRLQAPALIAEELIGLSEIEGGFPKLQPRNAFAKPAMPL